MTKRIKNAGVEAVNRAQKRNFGTVPQKDQRLVPKNGERAAFFRALLHTRGPMTKRELSDAWVDRQKVIDRVQANKDLKSVILWVDKRVAKGELEKKGENGDEFGSILYGYPEAGEPTP